MERKDCGPGGVSVVFGPQKGATLEMAAHSLVGDKVTQDHAMKHAEKLLESLASRVARQT